MAVHLTLDNESLAQAYDEISDSQFKRGKKLVDRLQMKPGYSILDIGSGTGRLGRHVATIIGSTGSFVGIDPLEERVKLALQKNQHSNAVYQVGIAEDLSFAANESIDVVYLSSVFHWVLDKPTALKEIVRVLKPGGRVGITTGAKELNLFAGLGAITDKVLSGEKYRDVVRLQDSTQNQHGLTTSGLIELLSTASLLVENVEVQLHERVYQTAQDFITFVEASSFGNFLNHVPKALQNQAKVDIENELETHRTKDGISFNGYTIFAVAKKP